MSSTFDDVFGDLEGVNIDNSEGLNSDFMDHHSSSWPFTSLSSDPVVDPGSYLPDQFNLSSPGEAVTPHASPHMDLSVDHFPDQFILSSPGKAVIPPTPLHTDQDAVMDDIAQVRRLVKKKRPRKPNWTIEETQAFLKLMMTALKVAEGTVWNFIAQGLLQIFPGSVRTAKNCEDLWGTLLKRRRRILEHEASRRRGSQQVDSFWDMDASARSELKLPKVFPPKWWDMMEMIKPIGGQEFSPATTLQLVRSAQDVPATSNTGRSELETGDKVLTPPAEALLTRCVEEEYNSALRSARDPELMSTLAGLVKERVRAALKAWIQLLPLPPGSCALDDVYIAATLGDPFIRKQIQDTLRSELQEMSKALRDIEQVQQEGRATRQAIYLKRMKLMKGKRQCAGNGSGQNERPRSPTSS